MDDFAAPWLSFAALVALLAGTALLTIFAGPVTDYLQDTAAQLTQPAPYIDFILQNQEGTK